MLGWMFIFMVCWRCTVTGVGADAEAPAVGEGALAAGTAAAAAAAGRLDRLELEPAAEGAAGSGTRGL